VIPAFNFLPPDYKNGDDYSFTTSVILPVTKAEVVEAIKQDIFTYKHWLGAHESTNVGKWILTDNYYRVQITSNYYEPYIISNLNYIPLFDERFIYYGDDKAQWNRHLAHIGFQYWVVPNHFVVHIPHLQNSWAGAERAKLRPQILLWINDFADQLNEFAKLVKKWVPSAMNWYK